MTKYILLVGGMMFFYCANSQKTEPTGEIEDVQVIIEKDKPLTLPKAGRMYEKTQLKKFQPDTISLKFDVSQPQFGFAAYEPSFETKSFVKQEKTPLPANYVKAGYGNYQSPLIEAYIGLSRNENAIAAWFKHESFSSGPVRDEASGFAQNTLRLDGHWSSEYFKLKPILEYERESFYYYGYDYLAYSLSSETFSDRYFQDRAVYENLNIGGTIMSDPSEKLSVSVTPIYHRSGMNIKGAKAFNVDNGLELKGLVGYAISPEMKINTALGYHWSQYGGSSANFDRSRALLNPAIDLQRDELLLHAGFKLIGGKDSTSKAYIYPDVMVKYFLSEELAVSAVIDGDLEMNTLSSLYNQNRYLDDSLALLNTNRAFGIKGVVSGKVNDGLVLEGFAGYDVLKNQILFAQSQYDSSRFSALYDNDFGRFQLGIKGALFIASSIQVNGAFTYFAYKEGSEAQAWYLPLNTLELAATHQFIDVFTAKAKLVVMGGMKAPYVNAGNDASLAESYRAMDGVYDLSLGLDYAYNNQIGAFLQINNVFTKEYERYLNYPSRGIALKLGGVYRF